MKLNLIQSLGICLVFFFSTLATSVYGQAKRENHLAEIITEFKDNIMNKRKCRIPRNKTRDLIEEINNDIKYGDYSSSELGKLKTLKKEAGEVLDFMVEVPNCGSTFPAVRDFYSANDWVGANISKIVKDKGCVDVIEVEINGYQALMMENKSDKNYRIKYNFEYEADEGLRTRRGSGQLATRKNSVRFMRDNREKEIPDLSNLEMSCEEIAKF